MQNCGSERERERSRLLGTQTDLERRRTIRSDWVIIRQETDKKETRRLKMQRCNERKQRRKGATQEGVATTERKTCKCPNLETSENDRTREKERTTERQKDRKTEARKKNT